jgi:heme/copper-type cytochrome/quinol oxidase subunit 3
MEQGRGRWGMGLFILTEAALFADLFFAYFYLGTSHPTWPPDPPKLLFASVLTVMLVASSAVLFLADSAMRRGRTGTATAAVAMTLLLGVGFVGIQALEYRDHLRTLQPTESSYGSIFYTITSFHGAHVLIGLLLLGFVLAQMISGKVSPAHHQPLRNASWYWHFVDVVWLAVFFILYVSPRIYQ